MQSNNNRLRTVRYLEPVPELEPLVPDDPEPILPDEPDDPVAPPELELPGDPLAPEL